MLTFCDEIKGIFCFKKISHKFTPQEFTHLKLATAMYGLKLYLRTAVTEEHGCSGDNKTTTIKLHCSKNTIITRL